jgi:hypothetical protein
MDVQKHTIRGRILGHMVKAYGEILEDIDVFQLYRIPCY